MPSFRTTWRACSPPSPSVVRSPIGMSCGRPASPLRSFPTRCCSTANGSPGRRSGGRWWIPWCTTSTGESSTPAPISCSTPEESLATVAVAAFPGQMEAGKTTLTAGLVRAGLDVPHRRGAGSRPRDACWPIPTRSRCRSIPGPGRSSPSWRRHRCRRAGLRLCPVAGAGHGDPARGGRRPLPGGGGGVSSLRGRRRHRAGAHRPGGGVGRAGQEHLPLQGTGCPRAGPPRRVWSAVSTATG